MYLEGEVGPSKSGRTIINTGCQFSFNTSHKCRAETGAHCSSQFGEHMWRRAAGASTTTSFYVLAWTISWLGFGLFDQLLLVRYPWRKMRYTLFGYLA
jgi:hypothetical protein